MAALDDCSLVLVTNRGCFIHVIVSPLHLVDGALPLVNELLALLMGTAELLGSLVQLNLCRRAEEYANSNSHVLHVNCTGYTC